jgi:hypothetical protein
MRYDKRINILSYNALNYNVTVYKRLKIINSVKKDNMCTVVKIRWNRVISHFLKRHGFLESSPLYLIHGEYISTRQPSNTLLRSQGADHLPPSSTSSEDR